MKRITPATFAAAFVLIISLLSGLIAALIENTAAAALFAGVAIAAGILAPVVHKLFNYN